MELLGTNPGRTAIMYFVMAIAVGAVLLYLPVSSAGKSVSLIDAVFTATSAVCVTGLTVLDTGRDFSLFGQIVILTLIQLGGLGIMTFATTLVMMMGVRLSFHSRLGLAQSIGGTGSLRSGQLLKAIVITTVILESLGALALFTRFAGRYPAGEAAYLAVFHSVSAFCNAGFSTFSNSLEGFSRDIPVMLIFVFLIITGGLGFVAIGEIYARLRNKKGRLSLHTRLCLTMTAILLLAGTVAFVIAEYENIFKSTGFGFGIINCFFQAVTARTAGFNTVAQSNLTEVSLLITIILMFIGACPGSTGGGIKTTTAAVIALLVYNRFRGRQSVSAFKRSVSTDSIIRALTVALLATLIIVSLLALLMFAEERPVAHKLSHGWFVDSMFEMFSAFGTVGLSLGMTTHLHALGKVILIAAMFIGRVGLLTLAFALARPVRKGEIVYVDETVMVG